jgi:trimeric autotransporter adhesin
MGPVAEDFKAAFGLAGDGKSIGTVDADGVALAAIQGLNQKLESENAALKARLDAIEKKLAD